MAKKIRKSLTLTTDEPINIELFKKLNQIASSLQLTVQSTARMLLNQKCDEVIAANNVPELAYPSSG